MRHAGFLLTVLQDILEGKPGYGDSLLEQSLPNERERLNSARSNLGCI
jgi:hypothetical protein